MITLLLPAWANVGTGLAIMIKDIWQRAKIAALRDLARYLLWGLVIAALVIALALFSPKLAAALVILLAIGAFWFNYRNWDI